LKGGEILGLIGPNGAGKTTLFNVIAGVYKPSAGAVLFKGVDISGRKPHQICHLGIARTFQIVKPFRSLTVLQNVLIGARFGRQPKLIDRQEYRPKAVEVLKLLGFTGKMHVPCSALNLAEMKQVDLARALATGPEVLLLDEVMAGLNLVEIAQMMDLIRHIRAQMQVTILMIEHVMRAVMGVSNRVAVLHHGEKIAEGEPQEVVTNDQVIEAYLGERIL
jgi:branched-chain amino acid transport system ATP-binding protein